MTLSRRWCTASNALTFSRIVLAPFIVYGIMQAQWHRVFFLFSLAAATDLLDGYLARLFQEPTRFGALLDPIADKVLIISCFSALAYNPLPGFIIPPWFPLFLLVRELIMIGGTALVIVMQPHVELGATIWGKLTTFLQLILIFSLFTCFFSGFHPQLVYRAALIVLTIVTCGSLIDYIYKGICSVKR